MKTGTTSILRGQQMSTLDDILQLLKDGKWHNLKEVTEKTALPEHKAEAVFQFLNEYDFIQINENNKKIKLEPPIAKFIEEIQRLEKEETTAY